MSRQDRVYSMTMALSPGSSLGPYEVLTQLGAGGMGEVYQARDTRLGRTVAIKVLPQGAVTAEHRARLLHEARTVSNLNHPNIVTLFDVGEQSGTSYLVLEFVPGRTLDRAIPPGGMLLAEAMRIAISIASAVSSAHAAGVLHRDLKPANIMINESGTVKVLDFGLAKTNPVEAPRGADAPTLTMPSDASRAGIIAGTPAYMSPEQAEGRKLDSRSDVFSFGAVLYEMLTGKRAFHGDSTASIIASVLREQPRPLREISPAIPRELERLLERCLRKDPARRMASLHDVRIELEDIAADPLAEAPATSGQPPARRGWVAWVAGAAAVVALGAGLFWRRQPRGPMAPPAPVPFTAYTGDEGTPAFSADGNQIAFTWNGPSQDNYDIYVKVVGSAEPLRLTKDPAPDIGPAWSGDGKWIYFLRAGEGGMSLYRVPPLGGSEVRVGETKCSNHLAWIAGTERLVCEGWEPEAKQPVIHTLSKDGGDERVLAKGCTPSVSFDARNLLYSAPCHAYADIFLAALGPGLTIQGEPKKVTTETTFVYSIHWEDDNRAALAVMGTGMSDGRLHVLQPFSGMVRGLPIGDNGLMSVAVAPTGRVAFSSAPRMRHIWAIRDGKETKHAASSTQIEYSPTYSPDGKRIAFESTRSGSQQIWVTDADGTRPTELTSGGYASGTARWSPDGRWIAFDRRTEQRETAIFVVDSAGGKPRQLTTGDFRAVLPSFSNDGKWVYFKAFFGNQGTICRVPFEGGPHDVAKAKRISPEGADAAFEAPDGKSLYYVSSAGWNSRVWQIPAGGGVPVEMPIRVAQRSFVARPEGLYYLRVDLEAKPIETVLEMFDPLRRQTRVLARVPGVPGGGLTVSPDGKTFLYAKSESPGADIAVVERMRP